METYGLRALSFSNVTDDELDSHVRQATKDFPFCGEQMLNFFSIMEQDIKVQSMRLRNSIYRVEQEGVREKRKGRLK